MKPRHPPKPPAPTPTPSAPVSSLRNTYSLPPLELPLEPELPLELPPSAQPAAPVLATCTRCKVPHVEALVKAGPEDTLLCPTCWREVVGDGRNPHCL